MLKKVVYLVVRFLAALIMLQTLYFKFTGSPESMYIFERVGMEPAGRWLVGIMELIASVLLIIPKTAWLGGVLALGLMAGAIILHLTVLGIEIRNDGGRLFIFGIIVFVCSVYVILANKQKIFSEVVPKLLGKK